MFGRITRALVATGFLAVACAAQAQEARPWYYNLHLWKFEGEDQTGLGIDLGHTLGRWLAFQARIAAGEKDELFQVDYHAAAHLRAHLRYGNFELYALGGYSYFKYSGDLVDLGTIDNDDGPAAGLGMALYGSPNTAITLEYTRHFLREADEDVDTMFIGILHRFAWPHLTNR
ncbi:hypothetical protein SVA_0797 [Sulfurifustis variabilis]|uniref:Outer membrane protein beta-barrel domain-containing protein n=1 Tax=Sulfurifustis variabilis TaxID=1675686 RepID=A0A1B4V1K9_9GAMM|nr:porin family protein [Sulfurifustis variabilis]BAU47376.1 hypothetical protein SVA_0797 [Sulfurifustis variabilis]